MRTDGSGTTATGPRPAAVAEGAHPDSRRGAAFGIAAYVLWGIFPLYFPLLKPASALEILLHRVVWSLLICVGVLLVVRGLREVVTVMRSRRTVSVLGVAAVLIAVNWGAYIYAVNSGQVVEASLGYFINPIVTVLLGVLVLRERLRRTQWVAVGIGTVAVGVLAVDYGRPPWIALTLAFSFGFYGLVKNRVGRGVGALTSLSVETALLTPLALAGLVVLHLRGTGTFTSDVPWHPLLLISTGVITAVPLLLFASAARRVPLSTIGLMQYIAPVMQFTLGVAVFDERMAPSRWFGFALVWLALTILTADTLRTAHSRSRLARAAASVAT